MHAVPVSLTRREAGWQVTVAPAQRRYKPRPCFRSLPLPLCHSAVIPLSRPQAELLAGSVAGVAAGRASPPGSGAGGGRRAEGRAGGRQGGGGQHTGRWVGPVGGGGRPHIQVRSWGGMVCGLGVLRCLSVVRPSTWTIAGGRQIGGGQHAGGRVELVGAEGLGTRGRVVGERDIYLCHGWLGAAVRLGGRLATGGWGWRGGGAGGRGAVKRVERVKRVAPRSGWGRRRTVRSALSGGRVGGLRLAPTVHRSMQRVS